MLFMDLLCERHVEYTSYGGWIVRADATDVKGNLLLVLDNTTVELDYVRALRKLV